VNRRVPSLAEVWASYRPKMPEELRGEWACALFYRPPSILLTPLFAACGFSPNAVTLLGLVCAAFLPWCAAYGGEDAVLLVGALGVAFCVLDCIDGNLARVSGRLSHLGAKLDGATDILYRILLYAALGLLAGALAAGLACALLAILARACRVYAEKSAPPTAPAAAAPLSWGGYAFAFLSGLDHLLPLAILLPFGAGWPAWLLAWVALYSSGDLLLSLRSAFAQPRQPGPF